MTAKQFYDWQTSGGTDDVMRLVACLVRHWGRCGEPLGCRTHGDTGCWLCGSGRWCGKGCRGTARGRVQVV